MPRIRQDLEAGISSFLCTRNDDLADFLKEKAIIYEEIAKSRTYLFVDEESFGSSLSIVAYFSIGMSSLSIPKDLSARFLRKLDGYADKAHGKRVDNLPVYLIGQLAKNDLYAKEISGDEIIQAAIATIRKFYRELGGRLIAVDCKPVPALHKFYEKNGFLMIGHNEENDLDQFVYFLNRKQSNFGKIVEF